MHAQHALPHGAPAEIGRLLAHLEQKLAELDRLQHDIADDAQALAAAAATTNAGSARSVLSIREAAIELGVSVSMVHKLLKQGLLGHLKVGARTLITPEHLARFQEAADAQGSQEPLSAASAAQRDMSAVPDAAGVTR